MRLPLADDSRASSILRTPNYCKKIAEKSPVVTKLAKRAIQNGADLPIDTGLLIEILSQSVVFSTKDHLEGINAFLEKRKPEYTGE